MLVAALALAGLIVGTVIAVLLDRLYTGAAWRGPVLPCSGCSKPTPGLAWLGLPGWLALRGRCPTCGTRLPARLLYVPLLGCAAFALVGAVLEGRQFLLALLFTPSLLALTATDLERKLLPNRVMYPTIALALALCWAWPGRGVGSVLLGGGIAFVVMFLLFAVMPGFGFGDVRLAGLLGLLAGLRNLAPALLVAALAAGLVSVALLLSRRAKLGSAVPYGPYLALGAFWGMLAGG